MKLNTVFGGRARCFLGFPGSAEIAVYHKILTRKSKIPQRFFSTKTVFCRYFTVILFDISQFYEIRFFGNCLLNQCITQIFNDKSLGRK